MSSALLKPLHRQAMLTTVTVMVKQWGAEGKLLPLSHSKTYRDVKTQRKLIASYGGSHQTF